MWATIKGSKRLKRVIKIPSPICSSHDLTSRTETSMTGIGLQEIVSGGHRFVTHTSHSLCACSRHLLFCIIFCYVLSFIWYKFLSQRVGQMKRVWGRTWRKQRQGKMKNGNTSRKQHKKCWGRAWKSTIGGRRSDESGDISMWGIYHSETSLWVSSIFCIINVSFNHGHIL